MAVIASFGGDGLTAGTVLASDQGGAGDLSFFVNQANTPTVHNSGLRPPRLRFNQAASTTAYVAWGPAKLGQTLTNCAVRVYAEFTAWPSSSFSLINTATGSTQGWKIDIAGTGGIAGELRVRDGNNVQYGSTGGDGNVIPLNTLVRLEITVTSTGTFNLYVYEGHSTTALFSKTITGYPSPTFTSFRLGNVTTTPTIPTFYVDDVALANTATLIGPSVTAPTSPFKLWNGTTESPLTIDGVWNGTTIVPLTYDLVTT